MRARLRQFAFLASLGLVTGAAPAFALLWPSDVQRIERDLRAEDVAVRRRAAYRLAELKGPALVRMVLHALEDPDIEVRLSAAGVGRLLAPALLGERLIPWLTEGDARLRLAAADALHRAPSPRALGPLVRALSDAEPSVRRAAATALGASGAREAVIGLLGRLDDASEDVRESVARALSDLGDVRAVVPLIAKIEDARPSVRRAVTRALGELGDRRATSALVLSLRDSEPSVRAGALSALGALGDISVVPSVAAFLRTETTQGARLSAIDALGRLGSPEAVAALVEALGSFPEEREAIVLALTRVGGNSAPALVDCLKSSAGSERLEGCALSLGALRDKRAVPAIRDALERGAIPAEPALVALGRARDPEALPKCLAYLSHADLGVRRAALGAARELSDPRRADGRAVEPLEMAFDRARQRPTERLELIQLLGRTGSPRAARLLVPIAEHADDLQLRLAALTALGELGPDASAGALDKALDDPEASVRLAAALSIRKSAPRGAAERLLHRLEHAPAQDRSAVALALGGALAGSKDENLASRVAELAFSSSEAQKDSLIEALAHSPTRSAESTLQRFAQSLAVADRSKAAEAFGMRADGVAPLTKLASDREAPVRRAAVWGLGAVGSSEATATLIRALKDPDIAVAANAASSIGRIRARLRSPDSRELCAALSDSRAAVRESALSALRLIGQRCPHHRERQLLSSDRNARVRLAAARLIRDLSRMAEDQKGLRRCASEEVTGAVANECLRAPSPVPSGARELLVFVVPAAEAAPVAGAPFALVRPDGLVRHGQADRRGAVSEAFVPDGVVELAVPASFEE